jgi:hypothetical protein
VYHEIALCSEEGYTSPQLVVKGKLSSCECTSYITHAYVAVVARWAIYVVPGSILQAG